ncbi:hypothetical protein HYPBUDRAFT_154138, partial [Hyphopichia burtonii NRRL Y-1933]
MLRCIGIRFMHSSLAAIPRYFTRTPTMSCDPSHDICLRLIHSAGMACVHRKSAKKNLLEKALTLTENSKDA